MSSIGSSQGCALTSFVASVASDMKHARAQPRS
jgi:hypothetical protein